MGFEDILFIAVFFLVGIGGLFFFGKKAKRASDMGNMSMMWTWIALFIISMAAVVLIAQKMIW